MKDSSLVGLLFSEEKESSVCFLQGGDANTSG
jgi:hypothetical protein